MKRLLLCLSILAITVGLYATDEARVTGTLTIEDGEGVGIYVVGYHQSGSSTNNPGRPLLVFVGNSAVIIPFDTIREMQCDGRTPESDHHGTITLRTGDKLPVQYHISGSIILKHCVLNVEFRLNGSTRFLVTFD